MVDWNEKVSVYDSLEVFRFVNDVEFILKLYKYQFYREI